MLKLKYVDYFFSELLLIVKEYQTYIVIEGRRSDD